MTSRVWAPAPVPAPEGLDGLRVWLSREGYVLSPRRDDGQLLALASTGDSPDLSDVPAGTSREVAGPTRLLDLVPVGYGLLVDGASPGARVVPASVLDALRSSEPPAGDEPDFTAAPVPDRYRPAADAATAAARSAGARRAVAVWADGATRHGLLVSLHRAPPPAFDAAVEALAAVRPDCPVRVVDVDALPRRAQSAVFEAVGAATGPRVGRTTLLRAGAGALACAGLVWQAVRSLG